MGVGWVQEVGEYGVSGWGGCWSWVQGCLGWVLEVHGELRVGVWGG